MLAQRESPAAEFSTYRYWSISRPSERRADHIADVDSVTLKPMQEGKRAFATGFMLHPETIQPSRRLWNSQEYLNNIVELRFVLLQPELKCFRA
jgi:hypothetical protein